MKHQNHKLPISCLAALLILPLCLLSCVSSPSKRQIAYLDSLSYHDPFAVVAITDSLLSQSNHQSKSTQMRLLLVNAKARNSIYNPISDSLAIRLCDYFGRQGNSNERMSSLYVLACIYQDRNMLPLAVNLFGQAAAAADTTSQDCDYLLLQRVHAQMGELFLAQKAYLLAFEENNRAMRYASKTNEALDELILEEQRSNILYESGEYDSALDIRNHLYHQYLENGYQAQAALSLGPLIYMNILSGEYEKSAEYMRIYEKDTDVFRVDGTIEGGKEVYYAIKGHWFLGVHQLDSAAYYFKKCLGLVNTHEDKALCWYGLAKVYESKGILDSALISTKQAISMEDSCVATSMTEQVVQAKSLFKLNKIQNELEYEREKSQRFVICIVLLACVFFGVGVFILIRFRYMRVRRKWLLHKYHEQFHHLLRLQSEMQMLAMNHDIDFDALKRQKAEEVERLRKEISSLRKLLPFGITQGNLMEEERAFVLKQKKHIEKDLRMMTPSEEEELMALFEDNPRFTSLRLSVNRQEYLLCLLVRLGFTPSEIGLLQARSLSDVGNIRKRLYKKITGEEGTAKGFDKYIKSL